MAKRATTQGLRAVIRFVSFVALAATLFGASACVTVKPQQRATLADPSMRFDDDAKQQAQRDHAIENREGAYGGSGVAGGGCGCN